MGSKIRAVSSWPAASSLSGIHMTDPGSVRLAFFLSVGTGVCNVAGSLRIREWKSLNR